MQYMQLLPDEFLFRLVESLKKKKKYNKHDSFPIIHCKIHSINASTVHWSKDSSPTQGKVSLTSTSKLCLTPASR